MPPKLKPKKYAQVTTVELPIDDIEAAPYNARTITNDAMLGLARSLEQFGLLAFPVVNKRKDGYRLVGGHQRLEALKRQGEATVRCVVVEFDDARERQANFALNNRTIQGEFIPEMTKALLDEIRASLGADAPDFSDLRFDLLLKTITRQMRGEDGVDNVESAGNVDDDTEVGVQKTSAVSKAGSYYRLGDHVLFCGKLEGKAGISGFKVDRADMGFTHFAERGNVTAAFVDVLLTSMLSNVDGAIYVAGTTDGMNLLVPHFTACGGHWSQNLIWYSPESRPSNSEAYRDVILPVLYGWREGSTHYWSGARDQGNVFTFKRVPKTALPVEVVVRILLNSSKAGGVIFDPCVGKGVSVIAAEKTKRKVIGHVWNAREMDAIRKRWTEFARPKGTNWRSATVEI